MRAPVYACLACCAALAAASPARAADTAPLVPVPEKDRKSVELTVYGESSALVRETRTVNLPAGECLLRMTGVPMRLAAESPFARTASGTVDFLEQSFEDVSNPAVLLERCMGTPITLVETDSKGNRTSTSAVPLSFYNGPVYLIDGKIVLDPPGVKYLPGNPLGTAPALDWRVRSKSTRQDTLEVFYLTDGLGWKAEYTLLAGPGDTASLQAWASVGNHSGTTFENARLRLAAGKVRRESRRARGVEDSMMMLEYAAPAKAAAPGWTSQSFFEYHLLSLDRPVTLENGRTVQFNFLRAASIPVRREFAVESDSWFDPSDPPAPDADKRVPVKVYVVFDNTRENGLGTALPEGTVRVYQSEADGTPHLAGESPMPATPEGRAVRLETGQAFDLVAERSPTDVRKGLLNIYEAEWEISVTNRRAQAATVAVIEHPPAGFELLTNSIPAKQVDARTLRFEITLSPGQQSVVRYRIRARH